MRYFSHQTYIEPCNHVELDGISTLYFQVQLLNYLDTEILFKADRKTVKKTARWRRCRVQCRSPVLEHEMFIANCKTELKRNSLRMNAWLHRIRHQADAVKLYHFQCRTCIQSSHEKQRWKLLLNRCPLLQEPKSVISSDAGHQRSSRNIRRSRNTFRLPTAAYILWAICVCYF